MMRCMGPSGGPVSTSGMLASAAGSTWAAASRGSSRNPIRQTGSSSSGVSRKREGSVGPLRMAMSTRPSWIQASSIGLAAVMMRSRTRGKRRRLSAAKRPPNNLAMLGEKPSVTANIDVTVAGARRGDFADASLDTSSIAFVLDCHVWSNNSVRVTGRNASASTVDPAATPQAVQVVKRRVP